MAKRSSASDISPEYVLLGFLNQQPAHGYELHEQITQELGHIWHISLSQTYNILNRLEARGYIVGSLMEQEKAPARRRFNLTSKGNLRFEEWLNAPSDLSTRAIRLEFLTRLYFMYQTRFESVSVLIEAQIATTQRGLERLKTILADLPPGQPFNRLGLELRVHQVSSLLAWLQGCQTHLKMPPDTTEANSATEGTGQAPQNASDAVGESEA